MSVIINDFEVVVEPPPTGEAGSGGEAPSGPPPRPAPPSPLELEDLVARQAVRNARLRAH